MKTNKQESMKALYEILKPGDKVYTILRHVSASGMTRRISVKAIKGGTLCDITHHVANVAGFRMAFPKEGLRVSGCGMDMGFEVVYRLGAVLWPKGDGKTITGRNGDKKPETDGGYILRQEWL